MGQKLSPLEEQRLRVDALTEINEISPTLEEGTPQDPQAAVRLISQIQSQSPYEINVPEARAELDRIRTMVPEGQREAYAQASRAVNDAENAQREQSTWYGKYSNNLQNAATELLVEELVLDGPILSNAQAVVQGEAQKRMTSILQQKTIENNGQPVSQEVINSAWFEVWNGPNASGGLQQEVLDGKFKVPGVGDAPAPEGEIPKPLKEDSDAKNPIPKGVGLDQLNSFPRRSVRLRSYRDVTKGPILTAEALIQVMQAAAKGKKGKAAASEEAAAVHVS